MMRKFSKILALVLAFAMVLCPVLTAAAETESVDDYSVAAFKNEPEANGVFTAAFEVTTLEEINAITFKIKFAKGVTFNPDTDTVTLDADATGDAASAWTVAESYDDGVLTVLAYDKSDRMDAVAGYLYFKITLTVDNISNYEFYLTEIFAVGAGAQNGDEVVSNFRHADNTQSGVIDVEAARKDESVRYIVSVSCEHANRREEIVDATCTTDGSVTVYCVDCGAVVVETTPIPSDGHQYDVADYLIADTEEDVGYIAYDAICSVCGEKNANYYDAEGNVLPMDAWAEYIGDTVEEVDDIVGDTHECDFAELDYDENGHWYVCDECGATTDVVPHVWGEGVETTPAQPGVAGVMTYTCECGATKTEEIPALPTGPVLDESLKSVLYKRQMLIRNKFGFYFTLVFGSVKYDDFEFTVSKREISATTYSYSGNTPSVTFSKSNCDSNSYPAYGMYYLSYADISIFEMSVDITYTLTIYEDGVATKYYTFDSETLAEVADIYYTENFNNATNRAMAVDILNLGTAAQVHFAAEGPDGNTLSTFSAPNANIDQQYKTPYGEITEIDGTRDKQITTQMLFKSAPSLYYTINLAAAGCTDPSALTFTATYYSKGLDKTETRQVNGSELSTEKNGEGEFGKYGLYYFAFDQVALFDTNKLVTLTITDGTNTWTYEYSVESQLSKNINDTGTVGDLYRAVASFAASARNFWPEY